MRCYVLMVMLAAGLMAAGLAAAQEPGMDKKSFEEAIKNIELQNKELDLRERQVELDFRQECQRIELEKKQAEVEKQKQMMKMPPHGAQICKPGMPGCPPVGRPDTGGMPSGKRPYHGRHCIAMLLFAAIIHVLLCVWVYQDIRKRNAGSGIWIVLALMTGLLGALVYAVVRMGDARQT